MFGNDHYGSGADGPFPECRGYSCHLQYRKDRYCKYAECPHTPGCMIAIKRAMCGRITRTLSKILEE